MGTTRDAVKKRLDRLAQRMGVCPIHGTRLFCGHEYLETHDWAGTPEELDDVVDLIHRMEPYLVPLVPSGQVCPTCPDDHPLYCEACCDAQAMKAGPTQIYIPDEVMTQAEYDRYHQLIKLMREKSPDQPAPAPEPTPLPEPPVLPVPVPAPTPLPVPPPVAAPVVSRPAPAPVAGDEDEEVDAELADLVKELTRKLGAR